MIQHRVALGYHVNQYEQVNGRTLFLSLGVVNHHDSSEDEGVEESENES